MIQELVSDHEAGTTEATGLSIRWQAGPIEGEEPNGALLETVLAAVADRLEHHQAGPEPCAENDRALEHLDAAVAALHGRAQRRQGT